MTDEEYMRLLDAYYRTAEGKAYKAWLWGKVGSKRPETPNWPKSMP